MWLLIISAAATTFVYLLVPAPWLTGTLFTNPLRVSDPSGTVLLAAEYTQSVTALLMIPAAASLLVRLRRAADEQRRQVRLFCIGSAVAIVAYIVLGWAGVAWLGFTLTWPTIAFAAGAGIVRHRLFDVDAVLSRALVLALLTAFVAVVYVVVVGVVGAVAGVRRDDPLLAVVAAATAAVAFEPVRRRARDAADRLVYGHRLSPYEVLAQFAERLRQPVPATQIVDDLVRLLAVGTGAAQSMAWLRVGDGLRLAAAWPQGVSGTTEIAASEPIHLPDADLVQPVRDDDDLLAVLALRTHRGDVLTSSDRDWPRISPARPAWCCATHGWPRSCATAWRPSGRHAGG